MQPERKTARINARVPASLVERVGYVVRNSQDEPRSLSVAVQRALEAWLPDHEKRLAALGLTPPKKVPRQG